MERNLLKQQRRISNRISITPNQKIKPPIILSQIQEFEDKKGIFLEND